MRSFVSTLVLLVSGDAFLQVSPATQLCDSVRTRNIIVTAMVLPQHQSSRSEFLQQAIVGATAFASGGLFLSLTTSVAYAEEDAVVSDKAPTSIAACKLQGGGKPSNCISTSSVKQVDCYVAPWTFDCSAAEAQARLKGVFAADPMTYSDMYDEVGYLRVTAARGLVTDQLEFVIDDKEKLVKMRSAELSDAPSISDFGANRRRLDGIRKEAKVFDVMGGSFDSIENRGTGPVGQLKAFYGLQSGAGFEDLYDE